MSLYSLLLSALTIVLSTSSFATTEKQQAWTRYQNYKIHLNTPKDWVIERDLYGMPITVLGPMRNGERAALSIQHTPIYGLEFNHDLLKKTKKQYYNGRKEWVDKIETAEYLGDLPYRRLRWQNGNDGFEMGFRYSDEGTKYEERSIQVNCGKRLYLVKTLSSDKVPNADKAILSKLVNELNCVATNKSDGQYKPSELQDFSHKIQDVFAPSSWPTRAQIKSAKPEAKTAMIAAAIDFYKEFEEAANEETYAIHSTKKDDKAFSLIKDRMDRFVSAFSGIAWAENQYDCFFGGWPSKYIQKNGVTTCGYPEKTNPSYTKAKDSCDDGEMACNPSLFGNGTCISIDTSSERNHATLNCESKFRASGKTFDDLAKSPDFDSAILDETLESAKSVCGAEPYVTENYGLCSTLKEKLALSINVGGRPETEEEQSFINGLEKIKPEDYELAVDTWLANKQDFESKCVNAQGQINQDTDCANMALQLSLDADKLEKAGQYIEKELGEETAVSNVPNNAECVDCGTGSVSTVASTSDESSNAKIVDEDENGCTAKDKKNGVRAGVLGINGFATCIKKNFTENNIFKAIGNVAGTGIKCLGNAVLGLVRSLWDTVKAIGELIWDGIKWVGGKIQQGWNWLWGIKDVEDQTSNKIKAAAKTSNGAIKEFKNNPVGTAMSVMGSIGDAIADYAKNNTYCEEWSGVPQFSTCTKPGNFSCMTCDTLAQGTCTAIGYVVGEIGPSLFTGGATSALKGTAIAAKVTKVLKRTKDLGKLVKIEKNIKRISKVSKVHPNLLKNASNVRKELSIVDKMSRTQKLIGKVYNASRWTGKQLERISKAFKAGKAKLVGFKPGKLGKFKKAKESLTAFRNDHFILRNGSWVLNKVVNSIPVQTVWKGSKSIFLGGTKIVTGGAKLISLPVRLPQMIYRAQRSSAKLGYKYGEKWFNKTIVTAADFEKNAAKINQSAKIGFAVMSPKYFYKTLKNTENRIAVDWASEADIRKQAKEQGKTEAEITEILKISRADRVTQEKILGAVNNGNDPDPEDLKILATIREQTTDEVLDGVIQAKLLGISTGQPVPKFSSAEFNAYSKVHQVPVEQAKAQILEQTVVAKIELIYQGLEPSFTKEEYKGYAMVHQLTVQDAEKEISETVKTTKYKMENGIVDDSEIISQTTTETKTE